MASLRRTLGLLAMSVVALVVAHNLVFLLAYGAGYEEALAHSGHGGAWTTAAAIVIAAGLGLVGLALWQLYRLGLVLRDVPASEGSLDTDPRGFGRQLLGLWLRLTSATTFLFVLQENVERLRIGEAPPGLHVLGSAEYPNAILVIAAVALAVGFIGALFRWRRDALIARIAGARARWHGARRAVERRETAWVERRHASIVVHQFPGRAPPQPSAG
jgi:hypothetical protein